MISQIIKQNPDRESVLPPSEPLDDLDDLKNAKGRSSLTAINNGKHPPPLQVSDKGGQANPQHVADL